MAVDIKAPDFPESVDEGTLVNWLKQDGDRVERDEKIAEVETDKLVLDVYALDSGQLAVLVEEGAIIQRGALLARVSPSNGAAPAKDTSPAKEAAAPAPEPTPDPTPAPSPAAEDNGKSSTPLSPSVKKLVHEHDLDPGAIAPTGKGGRLTKQDVSNHMAANAPALSPPRSTDVVQVAPGMPERRVPMSRLRATIARRLKEVQDTAAILTTFNEVNMKPVMDIRARYKDKFFEDYGVKLGFMSFFTKAVVEALKKYPVVNGSIDGGDIVYHEYYNISIAVDSPRGLVVPVVRHANQLSFAEVEREIRGLAEKARSGALTVEDLTGGTFTITNGGTFGSMLSTPILNAPQSAILGMHNIVKRPWVENDEIKIRPVMYVALSYDHRIIDGRDAVSFLVSVKESLEQPEKLLLQL